MEVVTDRGDAKGSIDRHVRQVRFSRCSGNVARLNLYIEWSRARLLKICRVRHTRSGSLAICFCSICVVCPLVVVHQNMHACVSFLVEQNSTGACGTLFSESISPCVRTCVRFPS